MKSEYREKIYVINGSVVAAFGTKKEICNKLGEAAVGPFRTRRGAAYFKTHPETPSVAAAERSARA